MTRVLLTGMTSNQCNATRTKNTFYSGTRSLYTMISSMGDIDFQHGEPWDYNFNDFDLVIIGAYAMNSLGSARRTPTICRQLLKVDPAKTRVLLHYDDWHASAFKTGLNAMMKPKNGRRLFTMFHGKSGQNIDDMVQDVVKWSTLIRQGTIGYDFLLPMLPWMLDKVDAVGKTMGVDGCNFIPYDYCAAFDPIDLPEVEDKEEGWVLATKYDYTDYIESKKFRWPVIKYGCKKNGDAYLPNEEDVVREAYTKYWGLIAHPYPARLQGQGRDKFMLAGWTNSIIIAEPGEAGSMGLYSVSPYDIEQMHSGELRNYARLQREAYMQNSWPKSRLYYFLTSQVLP